MRGSERLWGVTDEIFYLIKFQFQFRFGAILSHETTSSSSILRCRFYRLASDRGRCASAEHLTERPLPRSAVHYAFTFTALPLFLPLVALPEALAVGSASTSGLGSASSASIKRRMPTPVAPLGM